MNLRQRLGTWLLGGPTEVDLLKQELITARTAHDRDRAYWVSTLNDTYADQRQDQRQLMDNTLDVMRELVESVKAQQNTLSSYLNLFTAAPAPTLRTMDDTALAELETKLSAAKPTTRQAFNSTPDPFMWMADRPDLFDPTSPKVLDEISQSIGDLNV